MDLAWGCQGLRRKGTVVDDYPGLSELRTIPVDSLRDWVNIRFPDRISPQWWVSVFELIEIAVSPLRNVDRSSRISDLRLGAEAVTLAVERGDFDAPDGAYWLLRLAATALELDLHIDELPNSLTPDGATAWALEQLPLSRDAAVAAARVRREQYLAADENFFAPIGVPYKPPERPDLEIQALIGVERILSALPWVADFVRDPQIRREVQAWLAIRNSL